MRRRSESIFNFLLVFVDAGMAWLAFYLAYALYQRFRADAPAFANYAPMAVIHAIALVGVFFFARLYHRTRSLSQFDEVTSIIGGSSIGIVMTVAFTTLVLPQVDYSRWIIVLTWLMTIALVAIGRLLLTAFQSFLRSRGIGACRVLIVGAGRTGRFMAKRIREAPGLGYDLVGFVEDRPGHSGLKDAPLLGRIDSLEAIIQRERVDEVIIALPDPSHNDLLDIIGRCHMEKVAIKVFPDVFQIMASEVTIGHLDGLPLLTVRDVALQGWKLTLKRAVDIIVSLVLLIFLSPLMLFIAFLVKLDSPGPAFYTQERMGLDARPFRVIKFRTMRHTPEAEKPGWTIPDDPRRTRLGAFLRRTSLDELPQFINVLVGDMSIVGPRPEQPAFVEQFRRQIPRYMERHREKAGITGWAQINGMRGDTSIAERTKYDLYYIENWSLWLDFKIMLKTIPLFFRDPQAY